MKISIHGIFLLCLLSVGTLPAQTLRKHSFLLEGTPVERISSNYINDILIHNATVWIGGGQGLEQTSNRGESFLHFGREEHIGKGGISAIAASGDTIWVATAFDTTTALGQYEAGGGLSCSIDGGASWRWIPQPVDSQNVTEYNPTTTVIQNITYDIALVGKTVWITSFGGGLRKSDDMGASWQVVTVDGYPFDALGRLAHRVFSVHFDGENLWVGSAAGVHKSEDRGHTWITFDQSQQEPISGNFVVAIGHQNLGTRKRIWAATIEALGEDEIRAVSFTDDGGLTWQLTLPGLFTHNFGFDPVSGAVFAATDYGLYKSYNGITWARFPSLVDADGRAAMYTDDIACAAVEEDGTLWVGSGDGAAYSENGGADWHLLRAYQPTGRNGQPDTYAYPNPFSPSNDNYSGEDGHARLQYHTDKTCQVTVTIYDFGMELVRTLLQDEYRSQGDQTEVWNGRNDLGKIVANGVYFYRIERSGQSTLWGKIMVVD